METRREQLISQYRAKMQPYTAKNKTLQQLVEREINLSTGGGYFAISAMVNIKHTIAATDQELAESVKAFQETEEYQSFEEQYK